MFDGHVCVIWVQASSTQKESRIKASLFDQYAEFKKIQCENVCIVRVINGEETRGETGGSVMIRCSVQ